jgi:hypothetical protein
MCAHAGRDLPLECLDLAHEPVEHRDEGEHDRSTRF